MPEMSTQDFERFVKEGRELILINGFIDDVRDFKGKHPGGERILKAFYGKDASQGFNGGLNIHTSAAINSSKVLRVAKHNINGLFLCLFSVQI